MRAEPNRVLAAAEARRIWNLYGFKVPGDLVVEDLAMAMGIVVTDGPLETAVARLVRSGTKGLVRVSQSIREPGRRKFAVAHEVGHWLLHERVSHLLACTEDDISGGPKTAALEVEASVFAGNLLMPEELFVAAASNRPPTKALIEQLAEYFGTTMTATALRYVETSEDYCVLVVSQNNRIRWWRASRSFGEHELWIDHRTSVPKHSAAASFFRGETAMRPQQVDLRDWLGDLPGIDSDTIVEQAIPLPAYGHVLSLLWLPP